MIATIWKSFPLSLFDNDAREAMLKKIAGMKCLGHTPIAGAITLVADRLKTSEQAATIVLVSDGEETCEGDPCALVKQLKAAGVRFVLHVIGFGVDEKTKAQLACIAEAGGGKYFGAKNADELLQPPRRWCRRPKSIGRAEAQGHAGR